MCCKEVIGALLTLAALSRVSHSLCDGFDLNVETFVTDPQSLEGMEGEKVILTCEYGISVNRFWIWEFHQHTGRKYSIQDNYSISNFLVGPMGELIIPELRFNHTGQYQCHVIIPLTTCSVFSQNASVIVISQPVVIVASETFTYNATEDAVIEGVVEGYPAPTVSFYRLHNNTAMQLACVVNSRVTISHLTEEMTKFRITMTNVMTSDSGTYVIQANNSVGLSELQQIYLIVNDPTVSTQLNSSCGSTSVIVGVVCSLVYLIIGVLLGVVSVYLIQRVRGRLSGPTSPSPPPLPPPATYEEVGVARERSHDIQLTSNESYAPLHKDNIHTSHNTAYGQAQL